MDMLVGMALFAVLLGAAWAIGRAVERAHFRRLAAGEAELAEQIVLSDLKRLPSNWRARGATLVTGEAVIATDYFKMFAAGCRKLIGGPVRSYESLVERARREALLRMLHEAQNVGANVVWNVRVETSTIQGHQQGKSGGVEVLAYGTAMRAE